VRVSKPVRTNPVPLPALPGMPAAQQTSSLPRSMTAVVAEQKALATSVLIVP
jgi:hypothetical protein